MQLPCPSIVQVRRSVCKFSSMQQALHMVRRSGALIPRCNEVC